MKNTYRHKEHTERICRECGCETKNWRHFTMHIKSSHQMSKEDSFDKSYDRMNNNLERIFQM